MTSKERREALKREIMILITVFPLSASAVGKEQLDLMAKTWSEDLQEFSIDTLRMAIKRHRNESSFFPAIADIRKQAVKYQEEVKALERQRFAPPPPMTDEEFERNRTMSNLIRQSLNPGLEGELARKQFNALNARCQA